MRSIFSSSKTTSSSSISPYPSPLRTPPSSPQHTFSESMIEENIEIAESIIKKWDPNSTTLTKYTSLFHEDRREAKEFLKSVKNLQKAMHFYVSQKSTSDKLVCAQTLMQLAMRRLEREFYHILSSNRDNLDAESVSIARSSISDYEEDVDSENELPIAGNSLSEVEEAANIAMADLKAIAECMTFAGYGKECVKIYKIIRKSIIDEGLYHLGVERFTSSQIQKMDWEILQLKIKKWLNAAKMAVKTLFSGERILCDHVFSISESIRESCFSDITKEGAISLFVFPESVAKSKKSSEKMFRILDLYDTIYDLWPEIESIFSYESTSAVRSQAMSSLLKLGDSARATLSDFESAIQKEHAKTPVPGGGLHPITRYVMNYISFLADYSGILSDIVADWPLPGNIPLPENDFDSPDSGDNPASPIIARFAWLILVLLCKLDGKAELYKDVSLSYLFLANNLHYIITKVRKSNLHFLLGQDWVLKHEEKVRQYAGNYERMGWSKVLSALPENQTTVVTSPEVAKESMKKFNAAFEQVYRTHCSWIVTDGKLRDEIKISIAKKLLPAYGAFYDKYRVVLKDFEKNDEVLVRYAPEDLGNYLSDLFYGTGDVSVSGSKSSSSSSSSSSSRRSRGSQTR